MAHWFMGGFSYKVFQAEATTGRILTAVYARNFSAQKCLFLVLHYFIILQYTTLQIQEMSQQSC